MTEALAALAGAAFGAGIGAMVTVHALGPLLRDMLGRLAVHEAPTHAEKALQASITHRPVVPGSRRMKPVSEDDREHAPTLPMGL